MCILHVYTLAKGGSMDTARVFRSGNSQAVRLPKQFRLKSKEVEIFSRSNARDMVPVFSRKTMSSARLKISTSLLLRRNCLGSRTAWLFPERNTLAVAIMPPCIYVKYILSKPVLQLKAVRYHSNHVLPPYQLATRAERFHASAPRSAAK